MEGLPLLVVLGGVGYGALRMTQNSISMQNAYGAPKQEAVGYVESLAEACVDPQNVRSDTGRFPVVASEPGPFGVLRNVHLDTGNTVFYTHGTPALGLHGI